MKGKLHKTKNGWTVTYITSDPVESGRWVRIAELPLHEEDLSAVAQTYIDDEYNIEHIYNGRNVEFEILNNQAKLK